YVTFSALVAYFLAKLASDKMYYNLLSHINKIRNKNGKASLSRNPTVWENSFSNDDFQIVRVSMSNKTYIGEIKTISGNVENGKDFILQFEDHWKKIMEKYEIEVVEVYIDTETKIVIETFHRGQCINAQDLYEKKYLNVDVLLFLSWHVFAFLRSADSLFIGRVFLDSFNFSVGSYFFFVLT